MSSSQLKLKFIEIVGKKNVLDNENETRKYCTGWRTGYGLVSFVLLPENLTSMWKALKLCVKNDIIIIFQAANTGLTGGSTPNGSYDRQVILINTSKLKKIHYLKKNKQVVCMPGSTLHDLENLLSTYSRQPHSVLGSSCIGASVVGGICNNSGGSLIQRGPAYTELSVFAQIDLNGKLNLVNNSGIDLGASPEEILFNLEKGNLSKKKIEKNNKKASDTEYSKIIRDIDSSTPSRYNADKRCLHESSGCAGKLAVFAVRLDTYPENKVEKVFYIGTNNTTNLTKIRRYILKNFVNLPVSAEYMHKDIFDISEKYGKDTVLIIKWFGTKYLPYFFSLKGSFDSFFKKIKFFENFSDKILQFFSNICPSILPKKLLHYRKKFEHHLILKMSDDGIKEAEAFLKKFFIKNEGNFFICNKKEGKMAELNRFAAAGAAVRYKKIFTNKVEDVLALDFSLPRNEEHWFEDLPENLSNNFIHKLYYGHFFCHVLHQDYITKKGTDTEKLKNDLLHILDKRGAEYPAEHNVGHLYEAKKSLSDFYKKIDPTNSMNPGIGKTSKNKHYL